MFVYIHIPFCNNICSYCDFSKVYYNKKYIDKYLDCLEEEINDRYKGNRIKSIYIGGGTPTSLDCDELDRLFDIISIFNKDDDIEFTMESNIESLDIDKIKIFRNNGVNRVSLGVQSFNNDVLRVLNRKHDKEQVIELVDKLKNNGIYNISIDLIYGVFDDIDIIKNDINDFIKLDIPHISCYSLIIEDNTVFGIDDKRYIDQDREYEMYKYIDNTLGNNGYNHYEISNYCKAGYESVHNVNYWNNGDYYGFGLGAVSYIDSYRMSNTKNLTKYLRGEYLYNNNYEDIDTRISNGLILGFRMLDGINVIEFNKRYDVDIYKLYNIKELVDNKMLIRSEDRLFINPDYFYMANEILVNFV